MRSRRSLTLFLLACLAPPLARAAGDLEKQYRQAAERLVCQCSCREQLTVCAMQNCHSATPMRAEIREALAAGKSVEEIIAGFVARVGKVVLPAPTLVGFDLAAWIAPFALLAAGLVLVSWVAVRMTRQTAAASAGATPAPAADPRVDEELREFEEES